MGTEFIHPPLEPVLAVVHRLQAAGVAAALGGSGLLAAHGLVHQVRDWDLTTDAPSSAVEPLLAGLDYYDGTDPVRFRTERRYVVRFGEAEVDLMCRFAIPGDQGTCLMPTITRGTWQELPLGSLEVWAAAYWMMGRLPKAELVLDYLTRSGADDARLDLLLQEPLPNALRKRMSALR